MNRMMKERSQRLLLLGIAGCLLYTDNVAAGLIGDPVRHAVQMAGIREVNDQDFMVFNCTRLILY